MKNLRESGILGKLQGDNLGATFVELANILLRASWGNQGILNEQLPSLHSAFWAELSPHIGQDFVHLF